MCTLHRIKIWCYKTKPSLRLWSSESISGINECTSVASDACCNEKLIMYTQHRIRQSIPRKIRCYKIKPGLQPSSSKKSYSVEEWRGVASDWFCNDGFQPVASCPSDESSLLSQNIGSPFLRSDKRLLMPPLLYLFMIAAF